MPSIYNVQIKSLKLSILFISSSNSAPVLLPSQSFNILYPILSIFLSGTLIIKNLFFSFLNLLYLTIIFLFFILFQISSDFLMIYDLEKSPKDNRIYGSFNGNLEITFTNTEVGNFFYPENKGFEFSLKSPYFTQVNSPENQIFLYSTEWDTKNNIAVVSEKSKTSNYKFIIISEDLKGVFIKKIYDLNQGKLYTVDNTEIKYQPNMDFFMKGFEVMNNTIYIYNRAENALFASARFKLNSE